MDTGTAVALGVALAAIISPIAVAIINNCHQTKIKKIEILTDYKLNAVEEYLKCLGKCRKDLCGDAINEYSKAYGKVILYASNESRDIMAKIDKQITYANRSENALDIDIPSADLETLSKSLRRDIKIKKYT